MAEVVVYSTHYERAEREILRAACEYVRSITDHPNNWAGEQEKTLIFMVRAAYPNLRCQWVDKIEYAGWADITDPRAL